MDNLPEQLNTQDLKQTKSPIQSDSPLPTQPPIPEVVVQPTEPKKKPILKIFAVLAIFLFLVLASELAYYFFTTKRREAGQKPLTAQIPEQLQPGRTTPTPTPTPPEEEDIFGGALNFEKIDGLFVPLRNSTKKVFQKGEITLVYAEGKVVEITKEMDESSQTLNSLSLKIRTETVPTEEFNITFYKEEIESIPVFVNKNGSNSEKVTLKDIKENDVIKMVQTYNILDKEGQDVLKIEIVGGGE